MFALEEWEILDELAYINSLQPEGIRFDPPYLAGMSSTFASLPKRNASRGSRKRLGKSILELKKEEEARGEETVEGVLGEGTVALFAGDSGIGKSPLLTQMGLCVAAGIPFLNQQVTQGDVLLVDYENGKADLINLAETISTFLGLDGVPESFTVLHHPKDVQEVQAEIIALQPRLVLIDAVRGFDPSLEETNADAGARLTELQHLAESTKSSIVLLHHLRKSNDENPPKSLEEDDIMHWLQQVSGPRALVNQTHTRIAIESYHSRIRPGDLVLKGHFKVSGPFGPWYVGRKFSPEGEPIGYERFTGVALLSPEHKTKYLQLPAQFSFTTALQVYGGASASAVVGWLKRLEEAQLVKKLGGGRATHYIKLGLGISIPPGKVV